MIQIRSLVGVSFETMTEAFNDAFSDYDIPAKYTSEYLTNLVIRRGYRPDLAVGAFEGNRLVGFVFNCLDGDAAYNSGTGVAISHRRQGIARRLMQRSIETLPARRYILEVIDTNKRAAGLYRELGFIETRQLQSWRFTPSECGALAPPSRRREAAALQRIRSWCDMTPSWQNDVASILRASEPYLILGDEDAGAVVFPSNGDVPILAVRPEARRRGKGRALLAEVARSVDKTLRIMNVEDRFAGFLEKCGAEKFVRQLEMVCDIVWPEDQMPVRKADAEWTGSLREGSGKVKLGSGAFEGNYSFGSRFENAKGTNPEELLGAAHAACFSMALSAGLGRAGFQPKSVHTTASVHIDKVGAGFEITKIELDCEAQVPNIDENLFHGEATAAKEGCPLSKALKATPIVLRARLVT